MTRSGFLGTGPVDAVQVPVAGITVVDVDGTRLVVWPNHMARTPDSEQDQIEQIVDSVRFS